MKTRQEILAKLAKWYQRAEEATSRKEVAKILRKAKKHARGLPSLTAGTPTTKIKTSTKGGIHEHLSPRQRMPTPS